MKICEKIAGVIISTKLIYRYGPAMAQVIALRFWRFINFKSNKLIKENIEKLKNDLRNL